MKTTILSACFLLTGLFLFASFVPAGYKTGDQVKDFSLKNVDGKTVSLSDYKDNKGAIVIFTCNHCPYAKAYEQRIIDLDKKFSSLGFPVIAISSSDAEAFPDDSYAAMAARARERHYTFPYLYDETQEVAKQFGAQKTPHVFVLNKIAGGYIVKYSGAIDDNTEDAAQVKHTYVADAVNALLQGKEVPVSETKAIGCTIRWKH